MSTKGNQFKYSREIVDMLGLSGVSDRNIMLRNARTEFSLSEEGVATVSKLRAILSQSAEYADQFNIMRQEFFQPFFAVAVSPILKSIEFNEELLQDAQAILSESLFLHLDKKAVSDAEENQQVKLHFKTSKPFEICYSFSRKESVTPVGVLNQEFIEDYESAASGKMGQSSLFLTPSSPFYDARLRTGLSLSCVLYAYGENIEETAALINSSCENLPSFIQESVISSLLARLSSFQKTKLQNAISLALRSDAEHIKGFRKQYHTEEAVVHSFEFMLPEASLFEDIEGVLVPREALRSAFKKAGIEDLTFSNNRNFLIAKRRDGLNIIISVSYRETGCIGFSIESRINIGESEATESSIGAIKKKFLKHAEDISNIVEFITSTQRANTKTKHKLSVEKSRLPPEIAAKLSSKSEYVSMTFEDKIFHLHNITVDEFYQALGNIKHGPQVSVVQDAKRSNKTSVDAMAVLNGRLIYLGFAIADDGTLVPYTAYEPEPEKLDNIMKRFKN